MPRSTCSISCSTPSSGWRDEGTRVTGAIRRCLSSPRVVIGATIALAILFAALFARWLAPHDPGEQDLLNTLLPPMWQTGGDRAFPLGTDALGRDVLSRLLHGARIAMYVAVVAASG